MGTSIGDTSKTAAESKPSTQTTTVEGKTVINKDSTVARTGQYTASLRAISTLLPEDPIARLLATDEVMEDVIRRIGESYLVFGPEWTNNFREMVAVRYHWMNVEIVRALDMNPNIDQVVILGAGSATPSLLQDRFHVFFVRNGYTRLHFARPEKLQPL